MGGEKDAAPLRVEKGTGYSRVRAQRKPYARGLFAESRLVKKGCVKANGITSRSASGAYAEEFLWVNA